MQSFTLYKRLISYILPYKKIVIIALVSTAAYASTEAYLVKLMQPLIDKGLIEKNINEVHLTLVMLILVTIVRGATFFISNYASRWVSSQVVFDLRKQMFNQLQKLPHRFFDKNNSGNILSKFNYDVLQLTNATTGAVITAIKEGMLILALLMFLFYQHWQLTSIILVIVPLVGFIINFVNKKLRTLAKTIQGDMGNMNHILDENVKGQKIIKIYHGQTYESKKFDQASEGVRSASVKSEIVASLTTPTIELLIMCVLVIIISYGAHEVTEGKFSIGGFITYITMMTMLFKPIKNITRINEVMQRGLAASESIFNFLDAEIEHNHKDSLKLPNPVLGQLTFDKLNFVYETDTILNELSFSINAGENIALVGASGSGKSSIANLIPRFYELNSGKIFLDGVNIAELDLDLLRQQISFINQDIVLFEGSVYENIAYGVNKAEIEHEKVKMAADTAFATEFINDMELGFNTQIGESGSRLSGGQKQRIAIARAVYKNAPIFILDEATSALDNESEQKVQLALEELIKHKTSIIIAHRLTTVKNADRIIVLDKGKIVEIGNHNELVEQKGVYYRLQREKELY